MTSKSFSVLLVEDNPADVRLAREAFKTGKVQCSLSVVKDGVDAMDYLQQKGAYLTSTKPDLIFLDLNLPRKDGREVLAEIKGDPKLRRIPVVVFTTSQAESDILASYDLHANCYVVKPADLDRFFEVIHNTEDFWLNVVTQSST